MTFFLKSPRSSGNLSLEIITPRHSNNKKKKEKVFLEAVCDLGLERVAQRRVAEERERKKLCKAPGLNGNDWWKNMQNNTFAKARTHTHTLLRMLLFALGKWTDVAQLCNAHTFLYFYNCEDLAEPGLKQPFHCQKCPHYASEKRSFGPY